MLDPLINNAHLLAELDLVREILLDFFAAQIEGGTVKRDDVAAQIHSCAERVIADKPDFEFVVNQRVPGMIDRLPID